MIRRIARALLIPLAACGMIAGGVAPIHAQPSSQQIEPSIFRGPAAAGPGAGASTPARTGDAGNGARAQPADGAGRSVSGATGAGSLPSSGNPAGGAPATGAATPGHKPTQAGSNDADASGFPRLTGRVVDSAAMLSPATVSALDGKLAALERDKGIQFVVATIPSLNGAAIDDYGYQLGRAWGIGRKGIDDGVILLIAQQERKVRIDVGYGLTPVLTAGLSGLIINQQIVPHFKQGDYDAGVMAGADAIITQLRLPAAEAEARAKSILAEQQAAARQSAMIGNVVFIVFVVFVLFMMFRARRGLGPAYRRGGAPVIIWGPGGGGGFGGGGFGGGGFGGGGFGGGGFSGGGGSFGGGGASGGW